MSNHTKMEKDDDNAQAGSECQKPLVRWCVQSLDGWCGVQGGRRPAMGENNVETRCGMWVAMPWGIERREPTCPDCIKANAERRQPEGGKNL